MRIYLWLGKRNIREEEHYISETDSIIGGEIIDISIILNALSHRALRLVGSWRLVGDSSLNTAET